MTVAPPLLYCPPRVWEHEPWPEPVDPPLLQFDRQEPRVDQTANWTCACASLAWVMNALGEPAPDDGGKWNEWTAVVELRRVAGDRAVTPEYGLAWASGVDLELLYNTYGYACERLLDASWADLVYLCDLGVGQLGGARWYHWSGLRDYDGLEFELANPAGRWKNVGQQLDAAEWNAWGRWNAVVVTERL
jgi:hypothetical protein